MTYKNKASTVSYTCVKCNTKKNFKADFNPLRYWNIYVNQSLLLDKIFRVKIQLLRSYVMQVMRVLKKFTAKILSYHLNYDCVRAAIHTDLIAL